MEADQLRSIEKAINRMTIAIWSVFFALFLIAVPSLLMVISPGTIFGLLENSDITVTESEFGPTSIPKSATFIDESHNEFFQLSVDQKIEMASVIVLVKYVPSDNGLTRAIIQSVLKKAPGTVFNFDVGDEYRQSSFYPGEDGHRSDGQIIFFLGNPAQMRYATSYKGDRIRSLGNIPIELFKQKCADEAA